MIMNDNNNNNANNDSNKAVCCRVQASPWASLTKSALARPLPPFAEDF